MSRASGGGVKLRELVGDVPEEAVGDSEGVYCTARVASHRWRLHIGAGLRANDEVAFVIASDALAPRRISAAREFLECLRGRARAQRRVRSARTRSAFLHRAMLQALDGAAGGASQREIAVAIFGNREVLERWSPDGELRARVRYFLRRGRALVQGEYRRLTYF